jgi:hypothetical protein
MFLYLFGNVVAKVPFSIGTYTYIPLEVYGSGVHNENMSAA